jgi:hypothetical protein
MCSWNNRKTIILLKDNYTLANKTKIAHQLHITSIYVHDYKVYKRLIVTIMVKVV